MASLDDEFFAAFEAASGPLKTVHTAATPQDMLAGPVDADGWVEWRMRPCPISLDDVFATYAQAAGKSLPSSFRRWYAGTFTLDGDCGLLRLPANPSNAPGKPLLKRGSGLLIDNRQSGPATADGRSTDAGGLAASSLALTKGSGRK